VRSWKNNNNAWAIGFASWRWLSAAETCSSGKVFCVSVVRVIKWIVNFPVCAFTVVSTAWHLNIELTDFGSYVWNIGEFYIHLVFENFVDGTKRFWPHWVMPQLVEGRLLVAATWPQNDKVRVYSRSQYLDTCGYKPYCLNIMFL